MNYSRLTEKKKELDGYPTLQGSAVQNLDEWFRIELTYTSNAIEGNTLTRQETALVVEKGLAVGGKSLREHLEAMNHAKALDWVRSIVKRQKFAVTDEDILHIHELILTGIDDPSAGRYRTTQVRVSGSEVTLPNPMKVPSLMEAFVKYLSNEAVHPVQLAAEAHYVLATIHPFVDSNGRVGRLLMNLLLMARGYPPAIIQPRDRLAYIKSLEKAQTGGSKEEYFELIANSVDRSLDIYIKAARGEDEVQYESQEKLLKIGELAKAVNETNATIRYWTQEGLIEVAQVSKSGYQLYGQDVITRIAKIKDFKAQRYTLQEIKKL